MTRSRQSARAAGTRFETSIANALAVLLEDDRIERRARSGAKDKGDIGGVRAHGRRVVVECKDHNRLDLAGWTAEAGAERENDNALAGVVVHKRRGNGDPRAQYVTMTLADLVALMTGVRP